MKKSDVIRSFTVFIDILGFSEKVINAKSFNDLKNIEKVVRFVQGKFEHTPTDELTIGDHQLYSMKVLSFSDCVVVNIPYESEITRIDGTYDPILSQFCNLAYAQGECVLSGVFLRGGIDLGWWYQQEATLISSGLANAYKLEGKANFPVLAISEGLYNFFCKHPHNKFYSRDSNPLQYEMRNYKQGKKEFIYIDYITTICLSALGWRRSKSQITKHKTANPDVRQEIVDKGHKDNIDDFLRRHSAQIMKAFNSANSEKVKKKYRWLARYHNSVAKNFSRNKSVICTL